MEPVENWIEKAVDHFFHRGTQLVKKYKSQTVILPLTVGTNFSLDANGSADEIIYRNTTGKYVVIGRLIVMGSSSARVAYTPAAPSSGGYGYVYKGVKSGAAPNATAVLDIWPSSVGGQLIPQLAEYSGHNALRMRENENLSVYISGGPASGIVAISLFGFLEPTDSDYDL
jgi:hypothetical protein